METRTNHTMLIAVAVLAIALGNECFAFDRYAHTETRYLSIPGSPLGKVTDGNLLNPPGMRGLQLIGYSRAVRWVRIEQSDYVVPTYGKNRNRLFFTGNLQTLLTQMRRQPLWLGNAHSIRFRVWLRDGKSEVRALQFKWVGAKR